jgi:hypothetical protein
MAKALTPQEVYQQALPSSQELDRIVEVVNTALKARHKVAPGSFTTVDVDLMGDRATAEAVANIFRKAGWRVKLHYDQRDGDFWEFSL